MAGLTATLDPFRLRSRGDAPALVDAASGTVWSYRELSARVDELAGELSRADGERALVFAAASLDVGTVLAYLAALAAGHTVFLLDGQAHSTLRDELCERYRPDFVLTSRGREVAIERRELLSPRPLHADLRVLLSTSGTTGSPKLVRLSEQNILANARSIAAYLELGAHERAISSLPFHYSYGLSVLNSHLYAGGSVVVSDASIMRPELWNAFREHGCTSFAGVPYSYQILRRIGFEKFELPSLRTMTQAGGKLAPKLIEHFHNLMASRSGRLVVMYGQTEATARISYVPPDRLIEKLGSIGVAIPEGRLRIYRDEQVVSGAEQTGELVYEGPNVMLGYATSAEELALGDVQRGALRTGDLGHHDADGYFYVTGRLKRFAKVYGLRVNLDEVEERIRKHGSAAVVSDDERLTVYCEFGDPGLFEALRAELAQVYQLNVNTFAFVRLDALPLLASGKIDYDTLQRRPR